MVVSDSSDGNAQSQRNREVYASNEVVEQYSARATAEEIFPAEEKVFDRYFTESGARVLDVGCGAGRTTSILADMGFDVIGVDISEGMVGEANELFPDLDVRVGDAADLDFPTATFDYALFSHAGLDLVHPERERLKALREIRRVLKPGGRFAFSSHNSLYLFPALLLGPEYVRNFYLTAENARRLFRRYKIDEGEHGAEMYLINPFSQRRQLQNAGFEFVACVGKRENVLKYFEFQPYYVARKPD